MHPDLSAALWLGFLAVINVFWYVNNGNGLNLLIALVLIFFTFYKLFKGLPS